MGAAGAPRVLLGVLGSSGGSPCGSQTAIVVVLNVDAKN